MNKRVVVMGAHRAVVLLVIKILASKESLEKIETIQEGLKRKKTVRGIVRKLMQSRSLFRLIIVIANTIVVGKM